MSVDHVLSRNFQPPVESKGLDTLLVAMAATKTAAHKNFWIGLCIQNCFEIRLKMNSFSSIKEPITDFFKLKKKKSINVPFVLKLDYMQYLFLYSFRNEQLL